LLHHSSKSLSNQHYSSVGGQHGRVSVTHTRIAQLSWHGPRQHSIRHHRMMNMAWPASHGKHSVNQHSFEKHSVSRHSTTDHSMGLHSMLSTAFVSQLGLQALQYCRMSIPLHTSTAQTAQHKQHSIGSAAYLTSLDTS